MHLNWRSLAVSSLMALALYPASAATRPRYGGNLRVELTAQVRSLDPLTDSAAQVAPLLFDTLVTLDSGGHLQSALAVTWTQENDRRCRFTLRPGVTFSDGTPLTATTVAASLRNANPDWTVREVGDVVIVEADQPTPNLPQILALARNAIALRNGDAVLGTGPFTVADWQPGVRAVLQARDNGWRPRPYLDRIEMQFNRGLREQSVDLDLGRADVIDIAPEETNRQSTRRVVRSDPVVLLALRFSHTNTAVKDARVREAVSLAVDRDSIANILLQRRGEPAGGLLPNWITGYSFLFPTRPQLARARQLRSEARVLVPMTLVYRAADPVARLIAERIALNAADAGLTVRTAPDTQNIAVPDIELVSVRLPSADDATDLVSLARPGVLALPLTDSIGDAPDAAYRSTVAALKEIWAAPIAYVPIGFALSSRVADWNMSRLGQWQLENVSVTQAEVAKP